MPSSSSHRWSIVLFASLISSMLGCGTSGPAPATPRNESDQAMPMTAVEAPVAKSARMAMAANSVEGVTAETYGHVPEPGFARTGESPLSTFSIDVDTASYSNIRRFLQQKQLPPADAVRIEECINYFTYDYPSPDGDVPFAVHTEVAGCPWNPDHHLVKIGLQGRRVADRQRTGMNLVFLLDVSGSMQHPKKLPLVQQAMKLLVGQLGERDHIAIVAYAGAAGLVLPSTSVARRDAIVSAINSLQAAGSTNGSLGIRLAYDIAVENFIVNGTNRVILCSDGDFNVGITDYNELTSLIKAKAQSGVFLSVLGFGMGNLKDATMERLADYGNGNYAYIDSASEARKVLVDQMMGTLVTIAKDVKIQVAFNPSQVAEYRLVGYDNRRLEDRDFHDDTKDAGEIGAGHTVTTLYEIVLHEASKSNDLANASNTASSNDPLGIAPDELMKLRLRYKQPSAETSQQLVFAVANRVVSYGQASEDFRFASAVAAFGMLLKHSRYRGQSTYDQVLEMARAARGADSQGYRTEFLTLVDIARNLTDDLPIRRDAPAD